MSPKRIASAATGTPDCRSRPCHTTVYAVARIPSTSDSVVLSGGRSRQIQKLFTQSNIGHSHYLHPGNLGVSEQELFDIQCWPQASSRSGVTTEIILRALRVGSRFERRALRVGADQTSAYGLACGRARLRGLARDHLLGRAALFDPCL